MNNNKCHEFELVDNKYFCKFCKKDSLTLEKENLKNYDNGIIYAYEKDKMIGGFADKICKAHFGYEYKSNFGDKRQSVYFTFEGINYYGIYYKQNSDIIRYRKLKH